MKRLIYGMMVVLITAISCEKNDIKGYNEAPRLEFFNTKAECVFDDRDYMNEVTERALGVKVRCLGYALEKPLNFCLKTVDQMEGVVFIPSYEFPVGAETFTAQLVVPRPPRVGAQLNTKLTFDIENAEHEFGEGRVENSDCEVTIAYTIRPSDWDERLWGIYSNNKYMFMMDNLGKIYAETEQTKEVRDEVSAKYEAYKKAGNPPLMDDENPQNEIVFPKD